MWACLCRCVGASVQVWVWACLCRCVGVSVQVWVWACLCRCVGVSIKVCGCVCAGLDVCAGVWVWACLCAGVWVCLCRCVGVCAGVWVCLCRCVGVFAYVQCVGSFEPNMSLYIALTIVYSPFYSPSIPHTTSSFHVYCSSSLLIHLHLVIVHRTTQRCSMLPIASSKY